MPCRCRLFPCNILIRPLFFFFIHVFFINPIFLFYLSGAASIKNLLYLSSITSVVAMNLWIPKFVSFWGISYKHFSILYPMGYIPIYPKVYTSISAYAVYPFFTSCFQFSHIFQTLTCALCRNFFILDVSAFL